MGYRDNNFTLKSLEENIWPPEDTLETAPKPGEGRVFDVEHGHSRPTALENDKKACQECRDPVPVAEPHTRATVILDRRFDHHKKPSSAIASAGQSGPL